MLATIERAAHLIGAHFDNAAGKLGITQGEAHVLATLSRNGPTAIGTLHGEFRHKRSTLTSIVDRLEQRDLVRREINRRDRRSLVICLTPTGEQAGKQVTTVLDQVERALRETVTARDIKGLEKVTEALAG
ncbi:MAG: MarR family transcriptional regulator, partial [Solirubrobacterales bacterium]|nr:MarR family transcriptional regulator [Solirubrobacterales bacterium]